MYLYINRGYVREVDMWPRPTRTRDNNILATWQCRNDDLNLQPNIVCFYICTHYFKKIKLIKKKKN